MARPPAFWLVLVACANLMRAAHGFAPSTSALPRHRLGRSLGARRHGKIGRLCPVNLGLDAMATTAQLGSAQQRNVIIVGGGVGGIALAGRLSRARPSWTVVVLEKNARVGGRLDELACDGFRFDTGPSLLLAKDVYEDTFRALGSNLSDHVQLRRIEPAYRCFLGDNSNISLTADLHVMQQQLEALEEGSFAQYLAYMREAGINYNKGFASRPFQSKDNSLLDYANLDNLLLLKDFDASNLLMTHQQRLARFFKDPRLHQLFSFQDLYIGLAPHTAPAIFSLLQHLEIVEGVWYPVGGFARITEALKSIVQQAGVTVRENAAVTNILVDASTKQVTGVQLASGELVEGEIVVSNVDLPTTYAQLLPSDPAPPFLKGKAEDLAKLQVFVRLQPV